MRGLIYKDFSIFCKCIDKKLILIAGAFSCLLLCTAGSYGGLMASILLAMTIGMQNVTSFVSDDKARWNKYQMAMPLGSFSVVTAKYLSVICTLGISLSGSIVLNLISAVAFRSYNASVWGLALFAAVFIPLLWTGICLPLTYWFGVQSAQTMGLLIIIPVFYLIKYFEDGAGLSVMADSLSAYLVSAGGLTVILFALSLFISAAGYSRRK